MTHQLNLKIGNTKIRPNTSNTKDLEFIVELRNNPDVVEFIDFFKNPKEEFTLDKATENYGKYKEDKSSQSFIVEDLKTGELAGDAGLDITREDGVFYSTMYVKIMSKYWKEKKTDMGRNAGFLLDYYAFQMLGVDNIYTRAEVANVRAHHWLTKKLGYIEVTGEDIAKLPDDFINIVYPNQLRYYMITRKIWEKHQGNRKPDDFVNEVSDLYENFPKE